jgi:glucose-6-phosphate dehydrogenase assembly protein OpcA
VAPAVEDVWSDRDTTPAAIEEALRDLVRRRQAEGVPYSPARVLNLVAIVDRAWRGEVANRLERVTHHHQARTIICAVEPGRTSIDAWAAMGSEADPAPGKLELCSERIEIEIGPGHLPIIDTIARVVVVSDLPTLVWAPHGHGEAIDALAALADVVLIDSGDEPQVHLALARAAELAAHAHVVDLAWVRTTPWREHLTAIFDPPPMRRSLHMLSAVTIRHRQDSATAGLLLAGWLASRLDWKVNALILANGVLQGKAGSPRQDVALRLEPVLDQEVPGPAGVTVETAAGVELALDRVPGGLELRRRERDGSTAMRAVPRASRGEAGIFDAAVRQALAPDATYEPALAAARAMLL